MDKDNQHAKATSDSIKNAVSSTKVTTVQAEQKANELRAECNRRSCAGKMRALIWWIETHKAYKQMPAQYTSMAQFLKAEIKYDYSYMTRQLSAAHIENLWEVDLGTYPEWVLRPILAKSFSDDTRERVFLEAKFDITDDKYPTTDQIRDAIKFVIQPDETAQNEHGSEADDEEEEEEEDDEEEEEEEEEDAEEEEETACGIDEPNVLEQGVKTKPSDDELFETLKSASSQAPIKVKVKLVTSWFRQLSPTNQGKLIDILQRINQKD